MFQLSESPVQFLAGAFALLERYADATATRRAVLDAAGDARRVGVPRHLSLAFLIEAATDYLLPRERDRLSPGSGEPQVWVPEALNVGGEALTRGALGVRAPSA
jgi:hypothetical protein